VLEKWGWGAGVLRLAAYQYCSEEMDMSHDLTSVKVAALVADGFQRDQVLEIQEFLHRTGATLSLVLAGAKTFPETGKAGEPSGGVPLESADEAGFDALLVPAGQAGADNLSCNPLAIELIRSFLTVSKPVGAMGQGVRLLLTANGVSGRRITADATLKNLIEKAGGIWANQPVATDRYLVTATDSRLIDPFCEAFAKICFEHIASSGGSLHTD
jgi:protease I